MFRLILQTQGRLRGFSLLNDLLSPKVKSTLFSIYDLYSALNKTMTKTFLLGIQTETFIKSHATKFKSNLYSIYGEIQPY